MMAHRYQQFDHLGHENTNFLSLTYRFGNWAVQRCLEAASTVEERRKIVSCMRYVLNFLSQASIFICTFVEGGLSILQLIAMAVTSYKRHLIVKKTSAF